MEILVESATRSREFPRSRAALIPALVVGIVLSSPQNLAAAVFNVNSLADILNPPAGVVTLRSAIQAANASPGGNTINLTVAGTYKITIPGANEDANATGDFDILSSGGNLTVINNSGGAVAVDGNHLDRVFDVHSTAPFTVTFQGFTITGGVASPGDTGLGSGGGIRAQAQASLVLTNMVVTGNTATADGGGIAMENAVSSSWTLTINNSTISDNHAGDAGGGVDTDGSGTVTINSGSVISDNTSLNQGGGIYLDAVGVTSAALNMTGVVIRNNTATAAGTSGGGIANAGNGAVNIAGSTIEANFCGGMGGGFADQNGLGTLTIVNSVFQNNGATGNGGGIAEGGPLTSITGTEIDGNSSGGSGGGLFDNGTTLTLQSSTLANNTASNNGGGIELQTIGTGLNASTIINSTVSGNSALNNAGANGGGVDAPAGLSGVVNLVNDTIAANFASNGGGVFWAGTSGSAFNVHNTIIAQNTAATGPDANNPAGTFTDSGGNLIGVSGAGSGNTGFTAASTLKGTVASPLDPLLGPLANNGGPTLTSALLAGSPAIDKATGCPPPATDQRGVSRPQGPACDIGAFEFQVVTNTPTPTPTSTPTSTPTFTPTTLAVTATQTPTQVAGVMIPTLSFPMLALLGLALTGVAFLLLKK